MQYYLLLKQNVLQPNKYNIYKHFKYFFNIIMEELNFKALRFV